MSQVVFKTPNTGVLVRAGLWLAVAGLAAWFLSKIRFTLVVFGMAWMIAYLMNGMVVAMEGRRLGPIRSVGRGMAVGVIYLTLCALLALTGALLFPQVEAQVAKLLELQHTIANPQDLATLIQSHSEKLLGVVPQEYRATVMERVRSSLDTITAHVGAWLVAGLNALAGFFTQMVTGMFVFLSALLISIYILLTWKELGHDFVSCFPTNYRDEVRDLLLKMNAIFGGYLRATIITSAACGAFTLVAVWVTGIAFHQPFPYALVIALIAGLTYPIPIFGILASAVAAVVLSFMPTGSLGYGAAVGVAVLIVNGIIDRTLQPKLMGDAIGVSPLFVMFAAAAGGEFLGGVWGMLLGIPLAAMAKALWAWFHGRFLVVHEATQVVVPVPDPGTQAVVQPGVAQVTVTAQPASPPVAAAPPAPPPPAPAPVIVPEPPPAPVVEPEPPPAPAVEPEPPPAPAVEPEPSPAPAVEPEPPPAPVVKPAPPSPPAPSAKKRPKPPQS